MIQPIPSVEALSVWPMVWPLIEKAVTHVDTGYTSEDILTQIQLRNMQLWVVGEYQAAAVTQIQNYPQHKTMLIVAVGGEGLTEWFDELMDTLEEWGRKMGCRYAEEFGRRGWEKVGAKRGFEHAFTVMRKAL